MPTPTSVFFVMTPGLLVPSGFADHIDLKKPKIRLYLTAKRRRLLNLPLLAVSKYKIQQIGKR